MLGDPVATTELKVTSGSVQIYLPINAHIYTLSHDLMDKSRDSKPIPSVLLILNSIRVDVTMAMYSGNATLLHPQQLLAKGVIEHINVTGHNWSGSCQTGLTAIANTDIQLDELVFNIHINRDGTIENASQYYQLELVQISLNINFYNFCLLFAVGSSWLLSLMCPSYSLPLPSNDDTVIMAQLSTISIQVYQLFTEATFSSYLGEAIVQFVSSLTLPLLYSPAPVGCYVNVESLAEASHVISHMTGDDRVFELFVAIPKSEGMLNELVIEEQLI